MNSLGLRLKEKALTEGFSAARICKPGGIPDAASRLDRFVNSGYHGQMGWMAERMNWRGDPTALWPEAQSVLMLAECYTPKHDPLSVHGKTDKGAISVYAQNHDYHDIVKKRLKRVGRWLIEQAVDAEIKVFVDTAPVMEKPLAAAAGLGWQGKHTNLVSLELGSWFFLGAIFTTVALQSDAPEEDHCGNCQRCLEVCPTNAFPAPYQLDARKCISYLTIEHKGQVDPDLRPMLGNRIYGCDDCLSVCPWNKFAKKADEIRYGARPELLEPSLGELSKLDDAGFRTFFSKSPVKRIGHGRFLRNVLYAIGNSGDARLMQFVLVHLSSTDETVKDAARWAMSRLESLNSE